MNRCLNSFFDYCLHQPDPITVEGFYLTYDVEGREHKSPCSILKCGKDPLTCGNHLTFKESLVLPKPSVIPNL